MQGVKVSQRRRVQATKSLKHVEEWMVEIHRSFLYRRFDFLGISFLLQWLKANHEAVRRATIHEE